MRHLLRTSLIAALLAAPLAVPLACIRPAGEPFGAARTDIAVVHGIAINPRLVAAGGALLVDGVPTNPALPDRPSAGP